jgi:Flp pilus assembly pilin Flp
MPRHSHQLQKDQSGAALVEFALIAPVLVFALLGLFEIGYNMYMQAQLQGAVQKSARSSTVQNASSSQTAIDAGVARAVRAIAPRATVNFEREAYATFSDVAQPEDFIDANEDGLCNNNEQFEDANGNGMWDQDRGKTGFGGARDVVLYTVQISYPRAFGVSTLAGFSDTVSFEAVTVLRNQPYDRQQIITTIGQCD